MVFLIRRKFRFMICKIEKILHRNFFMFNSCSSYFCN